MRTPLDVPRLHDDDKIRFWAKVERRSPVECWPWQSWRNAAGYGRFKLHYKNYRAHRIVYALVHPGSLAGLDICHQCDNPPCVNPWHLFATDNNGNIADKVKKGRQGRASGDRHGSRTMPERWARGERQGASKLTANDVRQIRGRYRAGGVFQSDLAREYNVTRQAVWLIIKRKNWAHIA